MKKAKVLAIGAAALCLSLGLGACGSGEKNIMVVARESGSGTRAAFEEIVKKDGVKLQDAELTSDREEASGTGIVVSKVASSETAIGYISFSALSDEVKAVSVDGVEPTVANVQNGTYKMTRPFILMTSTQYELSPVAQDFFDFCMSENAAAAIADEGCVAADRTYTTYSTATGTMSGTITINGSTSMTDLMDALMSAYAQVQPNVTVQPAYTGSSAGRTAVKEDSTGNTIGLASSSKEDDGYVQHTLCIDAIAVIVNKKNDVNNLTVEQLFDIYTGAVTKFSELAE